MYAFPVNNQFHRVLDTYRVEGEGGIGAGAANGEFIFGIQREDMLKGHATTRTESYTFQMRRLVLRIGTIGACAQAGGHVTHSQPADLVGGGYVGLHQCRGNAQDTGDIVEAFTGRIGREQAGGIDRQVEQVANGILVFAAVHPVQHRRTAVRVASPCTIDGVLEVTDESRDLYIAGTVLAQRRHHAGLQLQQHLFPCLGIRQYIAGIHQVESDTPGIIVYVVAFTAVAVEHLHVVVGNTNGLAIGENWRKQANG